MIRIMLCDDQDIVVEGLKTILSTDRDMRIVATASDGKELLRKLADGEPDGLPDLVLMDLKMPRMNGIQTTRLIRERYPAVRVLVLTTYDSDEWVFSAIRAGASGYLMKDSTRQDLIGAIKGTAAGNTFIDPSVAGKLFSSIVDHSPEKASQERPGLSEREIEILKLIARGMSNAQIGETIYLSEGTVRNYTSAMFAKLDVADRTQAVVTALRMGVIALKEL